MPQPFIKKFQHNGFFYFYDVNTDLVIEVEKDEYELLDHIDFDSDKTITFQENSGRAENPFSMNVLGKLATAHKELGVLSDFRPAFVSMIINRFHGTKKQNFCATQKRNFETVLNLYVELLKEDPESLQVFKAM